VKRKPKSPRKKAVDEADKWLSLYIREKTRQEYGNCPFCKVRPIEHNFHFFSRVSYSTRWDELNCIGSCSRCNMQMEFHPYPFYKWFADHYGQFALDELNRKHNQIAKLCTYEIEAIAEKYKTMYNGLKK
jgi:hypothetical protein